MYKWIFSSLVVIACLFGIMLLSYALPEKEQTVEPSEPFVVPALPVDEAAAVPVYKSNCLSCHGDQLQGRVAPELSHIGESMTKEQIYKQIAQGGGGMPKFENKLTEEELITLTNWLASKK